MTRLLITGASGFIGRYILDEFSNSEGFDIHAIAQHQIEKFAKVTWHLGDLHDQQFRLSVIDKIQADTLLHLAWYTNPKDYLTSPENYQWLKTSLSLVEQFTKYGRRVIVSGSCAEYDWNAGKVCNELTTPRNPSSVYGESKCALYSALRTLQSVTQFLLCWPRIFFAYGPGEPGSKLLPSAITAMLNRNSFTLNAGNLERDYIHVTDIAKAMVLVLKNKYNGPVNIGTGKSIALGDLVGQVAKQLKSEKFLDINTVQESNSVVADTKILKSLGFQPSISLEEGIIDYINSLRDTENE